MWWPPSRESPTPGWATPCSTPAGGIIQERLEREFGVDLITTVPNVEYHVRLTDGTELQVESPTALPEAGRIESIAEPIVRAHIVCPTEYIGNVQKLCYDRRGTSLVMTYPDP